ncbi:hypothetical protein CP_0870 [Chlamydia pneumoniae AR39]|uniref:Uncharacterized protein n=1 Tax=Chlamydia pneumoniae TaxID=83558 RepID=Q9K1W5_CHLPN|nr:hypothetical protein CP_0870 [Chlamydia pneumoniae AR39]
MRDGLRSSLRIFQLSLPKKVLRKNFKKLYTFLKQTVSDFCFL